ncbi:MAG: hypothetical protein AB7S38_30585 [Vulcanimicrobiota bacterium]
MSSLFKKEKKSDRPDSKQVCYTAAYSLLPYYLYHDEVGGNFKMLVAKPRLAGILCCQGSAIMAGFEPDEEFAKEFSAVSGDSGTLKEGLQYRIIGYPKFPPLQVADLETASEETLLEKLKGTILAPHFSVVLLDDDLQLADYLVLGQALDGGTTLRRVTADANLNLGRGCAPELEELLEFLRARL